jgi:hypothetical protein
VNELVKSLARELLPQGARFRFQRVRGDEIAFFVQCWNGPNGTMGEASSGSIREAFARAAKALQEAEAKQNGALATAMRRAIEAKGEDHAEAKREAAKPHKRVAVNDNPSRDDPCQIEDVFMASDRRVADFVPVPWRHAFRSGSGSGSGTRWARGERKERW